MKKVIIGIGGLKGSGKDTVASMMNYINTVGIGKATYDNWLLKQNHFDKEAENKIIHFADRVKEALNVIYGIPIEYFNDHKYKDNMFYIISSNKFIEVDKIKPIHKEVTIDMLQEQSLKDWDFSIRRKQEDIDYHFGKEPTTIVIKLRTLMQYFGTEIVRNQLGTDTWCNITIRKAKDILKTNNYCYIPDVRMANEATSILTNDDNNIVILVERDIENKDNHESESLNFIYTHKIINDSTKLNLFYKVIELVHEINK